MRNQQYAGCAQNSNLTDVAGEARAERVVNAPPESKLESVEGAPLLDSISTFIRRFISLSESQVRVEALWVAHTHALEAADATPYLAITSPVKRSGKTRQLEVLKTIVANPWMTGRVTAAALVRKIHAKQPTLLLDESDAAFKGDIEYAEALRGVLNSGHERSGAASLCVGQGANIEVRDFAVFCPKAIAGIGNLPDTVSDRSIPIRLKRKAPGESVERFRRRNLKSEAATLREQIATWIRPLIEPLRDARPLLPEELTDRQQDGVEPLLAIADAAGGNWPQTARQALVELCTEVRGGDDSDGERLLADIRQILETRGQDRISSAELTAALAELETSPWSEWRGGKPLTQAGLALLLRPFGITPHSIRLGEKTPKGYEYEQFEDAFRRYLRLQSATAATNNNPNDVDVISKRHEESGVAGQKCEIAKTGAGCDGVAVSSASTGLEQNPERFGQPHSRLFLLLGKQVWTPLGAGRLETAFATRCEVVLDSTPGRLTVFRPDEIHDANSRGIDHAS